MISDDDTNNSEVFTSESPPTSSPLKDHSNPVTLPSPLSVAEDTIISDSSDDDVVSLQISLFDVSSQQSNQTESSNELSQNISAINSSSTDPELKSVDSEIKQPLQRLKSIRSSRALSSMALSEEESESPKDNRTESAKEQQDGTRTPPYENTVLCGYFSKVVSSIYIKAGDQVNLHPYPQYNLIGVY